MEERIGLAIDCVEKSSFCTGISLQIEDSLQVFMPHIKTSTKHWNLKPKTKSTKLSP